MHCVFISTHCLVVECHHLAAYVPKVLGAVIGWVDSCSFGVNPAHLPLIVSEKKNVQEAQSYICMWTRIWSILVLFCVSFNQPISEAKKDTQQNPPQSWKSLPPPWSPRKMRWRNSCFSLYKSERLWGTLACITLTECLIMSTYFWHFQKRWICWAGCSWPVMTLPHRLLLLVQLCPAADWQEVKRWPAG